ncbi:Uncharacterised protein [uncultured archaeon]|nr:Uncharacterised protein [uncultured archaeon]
MKFYTRISKTLIATGYTGYICEDALRGKTFYEFEECHIVKENIRMNGEDLPKNNVHYIWWISNDKEEIKIYQQLKIVGFSDYKPGKWYISTNDLIKDE